MIDLAHMRNFVAVAEHGQFSRAAEQLHLSQPSLSSSIKQLEQRLGVELLIRHSRGVLLTEAGQAFLPKARSAIAAAEAAVDTARRHAEPQPLGVGFIPPWSVFASQLLTTYRRCSPGVSFDMRQLTLAEQSAAVRDSRVDVALAWEPQMISGVVIEVLRRERRMVCLAASHPLARRAHLALEDIAAEPVPGLPPGVEQEVADAVHLAHLRRRAVRHTRAAPQSVEETAALIATGEAICLGPESLARAFARQGVVLRPLRDAEEAEISLVWRANEAASAVLAFVEVARLYATEQSGLRGSANRDKAA